MSKITIKQYKPNEIFSKGSTMTGGKNFYLIEAFYNSRYDSDGEFQKTSGASSFKRNAGAVQLFDISTENPLTKPYSCISEPFPIKSLLSSYGHSERIAMRDILDEFITENNKEVERPSYYVKSANQKDQQLEILRELATSNANKYKQYLENKNAVIKMWSERKPCDYDPTGGGKKCVDFIKDIFPKNSEYGYIAEIPKNTTNISEINERVSYELKGAYSDEVHSLGLVSLFDQQLEI